MVTTTKLTLEQFLALPETKPYCEYIDGEAVPKPMANKPHGNLVTRLAARFDTYMDRSGGSGGPELSVLLRDAVRDRVLLPDMAYWAPGRPTGDYPLAPPTLAVEVRSPSQTLEDQRAKCRFYRSHDVDVAWLVDPDSRTVEVFEAGRDGIALSVGAALESPHLPGFALLLDDLFAVLDR